GPLTAFPAPPRRAPGGRGVRPCGGSGAVVPHRPPTPMIRWAAPSTAAARRGAVHPQTAERRPVHSADDGPRTQRPGNGAGHARSATGESTGSRGGFGGGHHDVPCTDAPPLRP